MRVFVTTLFAVVCLGLVFLLVRSSTTSKIQCDACNIIIIGVDTLRADRVHALGYTREITPTIDALASQGFLFSNAISPSSWTVPSFMSIFTGAYPSVHGVVNKYVSYTSTNKKQSNLSEISPSVKTLAQALKKAGYVTGGFTGDAGVSASFGYSNGFDVYTDEKTFGGFANSHTHAMQWLDSVGSKHFFMFFHGYDLHGQFPVSTSTGRQYVDPAYRGPLTGSAQEEAYLREAQLAGPLQYSPADVDFWNAIYDEKVRAADVQIKNFIEEVRRRGLLDRTVIVVVADHGEEFYDHDGFDHGHSLYDELIRVPLIFVIPGTSGGEVIQAQVSTQGIAATLLDIVGVTPDSAMIAHMKGGESLVPYLLGERRGRDVYIETDYRDFTHKRGIRTADGWKYILSLESGEEELYNIISDPSEKHNLVNQYQQKALDLQAQLRAHIQIDLKANPDARPAVGCLPVYKGECE